MGLHLGISGQLLDLSAGTAVANFISGVTQPYYIEGANPLTVTDKNVGVLNPGALTNYTGTPYTASANGNGYRIMDSGVYEDLIFTGQVFVYAATATFRRCIFIMPKSFIRTGITQTVVGVLNGSPADIKFEDCEIHNRAQRPMNGLQGRNLVFERGVITGCNDSASESNFGSAPIIDNFGMIIRDSVLTGGALWYSNPANDEIHTDTSGHVDMFQKETPLRVELRNVALEGYLSEYIGTGTPGSGYDAGNTYVPTGHNYIATQAQMETWRSQIANAFTTPSQSMYDTPRRLATAGSLACIMLNDGNLTVDHCWFGGASVHINASRATTPAPTVHLSNNTHWNDMANGHIVSGGGTDVTKKGHAILADTDHVFGTASNLRWAEKVGGAAMTRQLEGGFALWR